VTTPTATVPAAAGPPQRYLLGIAYQAGPDPRIAKGADGHRDYFTAVELEKAAWQLMADGPAVGLFHADGTEGHARIVESYIWRGEPWTLTDTGGNETVVRKGDWLVGAVLDPVAWRLYEAGHITGWSPQGVARRKLRSTA
jgi:hypothetical protein